MKTYGYIVIHMPIQNIEAEQNGFLNIIYITSIILFFLSLVVLLVFTKVVYFPLKKITVAANEYAARKPGTQYPDYHPRRDRLSRQHIKLYVQRVK